MPRTIFADTVPFEEEARTPQHVRRNAGERPHNHDNMLERNRELRVLVFALSMALITLVPTVFGMMIGNAFGSGAARFFLGSLGFCLGIFAAFKVFPYFWIVVPQEMAFITLNLFPLFGSNPNVAYGPGGHFCLPWERREERGNIPLEKQTFTFEETIATQSSSVTIKGSLQFRHELPGISRLAGVDASAINDGFLDEVKQFLNAKVAPMQALEAKNSIIAIEGNLEQTLMEEHREKLALELNATVQGVQISSIDLPPAVQETRDSIEEARAIGENIWMFMGFTSKEEFNAARAAGSISQTDINRATEQYLAASNNATLNINRIDATGLDQAGGGGAIAAGLVAGRHN
jgi:hypothetical protein